MTAKNTKIHCNQCGHRTWHSNHSQYLYSYTWPEDPQPTRVLTEIDEYSEIWICLGCESATYRDQTVADGELVIESFYPQRTLALVRPKEFRKLNRKLTRIYKEIVDAFNTGSLILCAGGLRALLEGICNDKGIRESNLKKKIRLLNEWVPDPVAKNLHGLRFLGNQALHQLAPPEREDLGLAIEVLEDVMNAIYELDYKSGRLLQRIGKGKQGNPKDSN